MAPTTDSSHRVGMHRALIIAFNNWFGSARIPGALRSAGFEVGMFCRRGTYAASASSVDARLTQPSPVPDMRVYRQLLAFSKSFRPELLILGDEITARFLQWAWRRGQNARASGDEREFARLVERSRGVPEYYGVYVRKHLSCKLAMKAGFELPRHERVRRRADALRFAATHGYPVVLKQDSGFAGGGVEVCRDERELRRALREFCPYRPERRIREWARLAVANSIHGVGRPPHTPVIVQKFVPGRSAMHIFAAWNGTYLGGFTALKHKTHPDITGPASVIEFVAAPEIEQKARAFVSRIGYAGYGSLDFLIHENGTPYFLEFNSRLVPAAHLGAKVGVDLQAALAAALERREYAAVLREPGRRFALFPPEVGRAPHGEFMRREVLDVPWEDECLLDAILRDLPPEQRQAVAALRSSRPGGSTPNADS